MLAGAGLSCWVPHAAAQAASTAAASAAPARYRVVNIYPPASGGVPLINAGGDVAFSVFDGYPQVESAWFFDGSRTRPMGGLGGPETRVSAINDKGQVTGYAATADQRVFAYRWSPATGMQSLGALDGVSSLGLGIKNLSR
ncbi:hypothetical protein [Massilia sp. DWR3-1-1]|uniref:hypothetical protein n=1 Tax=Massilia sp. DWR3-1-1 TaxID=2804559 RepID=UPI003CF9A0B4